MLRRSILDTISKSKLNNISASLCPRAGNAGNFPNSAFCAETMPLALK
jgi:hypothetical protein